MFKTNKHDIWTNYQNFSGDGKFGAWIYQVYGDNDPKLGKVTSMSDHDAMQFAMLNCLDSHIPID